ncbi:MAG: RagB/SusD family nutrient uptake outer membrane protein [Salinibacter sp.]
MRRTLTIFLLVTAVGVFLTGCDQFDLSGPQPSTSVSSDQAFSSVAGFNAVLNGAFDNLQSVSRYGQQWQLYPSALADNAFSGGGSGRYDAVIPNNTNLGGYGNMYSAINIANSIIANIDGFSPDLPSDQAEQVKDRIEGEARFIRALNYFDLARNYSYEPGQEIKNFGLGVIMRLKPTRSAADADFRSRVSNDSVYAQVVNDLTRATTLLKGTNLTKNDGNRAAAFALLARVQLYQQNWSAANAAAEKALNLAPNVVGTSPPDLLVPQGQFKSAWRAPTHPESIFELSMQRGEDGNATFSNSALSALSYAECASGKCDEGEFREFSFEVTPSPTLPYMQGDIRLSLIDTLSNGTPVLGKYTNTIDRFTDRIPLIRVPELYLIQAEARAEGASGDPLEPLNTLRTARGLSAITGNPSASAIIDSVYVERRRELVYEGHRWFDLKRRGMDVPKPQPNASLNPLPYTNRRILAPLPTGEVTSNPKLTQNPGY